MEVKDIQEKVGQMYAQSPKPPKIGFIVLNKRTNTRLMEARRGDYTNPPAGTVVNKVITLPERFA